MAGDAGTKDESALCALKDTSALLIVLAKLLSPQTGKVAATDGEMILSRHLSTDSKKIELYRTQLDLSLYAY